MRFCDFANKLKSSYSSASKERFALDVFAALCGEPNPIVANDQLGFSSYLPPGLRGDDNTYRKLLFSKNNKKYDGLSAPVKAHILKNDNITTFVAYSEGVVSSAKFSALCADFNVSSDVSRALVFEAVYKQFMDFAKSNDDYSPDTFVADFVIEQLMKPEKPAEEEKSDSASAPLCAGDDFLLIRQSPTYPHKAAFYDKLTHYWVIKNSGVAVWDKRYMEFINIGQTPLKMSVTRVDIQKTPPGGEVKISADIEARHIEGVHEIIMDMKDCEGRLCFPDKRAELRLSVTVGWTK